MAPAESQSHTVEDLAPSARSARTLRLHASLEGCQCGARERLTLCRPGVLRVPEVERHRHRGQDADDEDDDQQLDQGKAALAPLIPQPVQNSSDICRPPRVV